MFKFLWQYSLLIQIKIKLVCFYYLYLQHPKIFKSRAATERHGVQLKTLYSRRVIKRKKIKAQKIQEIYL